MQHTQENYRTLLTGAVLVVLLLLAGKAAYSAGIADSTKPDLTPGTDVKGHQVASADLTAPVHVPGQILVPLKSGARAVMVDGKKLDPLLNPKPACH